MSFFELAKRAKENVSTQTGVLEGGADNARELTQALSGTGPVTTAIEKLEVTMSDDLNANIGNLTQSIEGFKPHIKSNVLATKNLIAINKKLIEAIKESGDRGGGRDRKTREPVGVTARKRGFLGGKIGAGLKAGGAFVGLFAGLFAAGKAAQRFSDSVVESQKGLRQFSPEHATAFARLERQKIVQDVKRGANTAASFKMAAEAKEALREKTLPLEIWWKNIENRAAVVGADLVSGLVGAATQWLSDIGLMPKPNELKDGSETDFGKFFIATRDSLNKPMNVPPLGNDGKAAAGVRPIEFSSVPWVGPKIE